MTISRFRVALPLALGLVACLLGGCSNGSSVDPGDDEEEELITGFHYGFEGTGAVIEDSSGNEFDGTPSAIARVEGKVGAGVEFLVLGSTIDLPYVDDYFPFEDGLSFMAWVKTDHVITAREQLIGGGTPSGTAAPIDNFGISLIDSRVSFEVPAGLDLLTVTTDSLPLPVDEWYHVAVTYDRNIVSLDHNGELSASASLLTTFNDDFNNQIGNNYRIFGGVTTLDQFYGCLDEVYLIAELLSAADILDYYDSTR